VQWIDIGGQWRPALRLASIWRGGWFDLALHSIGGNIQAALMLQTRPARSVMAPAYSQAATPIRGPIGLAGKVAGSSSGAVTVIDENLRRPHAGLKVNSG
jgi:hypothetical protein